MAWICSSYECHPTSQWEYIVADANVNLYSLNNCAVKTHLEELIEKRQNSSCFNRAHKNDNLFGILIDGVIVAWFSQVASVGRAEGERVSAIILLLITLINTRNKHFPNDIKNSG